MQSCKHCGSPIIRRANEDLYRVGPDHQNAKLSEADAAAIRADTRKLTDIAAEHGVSKGTVSRIKNGHSYRNKDGACADFAPRRTPKELTDAPSA